LALVKKIILSFGLLAMGVSIALSQTTTTDLTIYTGRNRNTIEPLIKQFMLKTKLKINVIYGNDMQMLEQLAKEQKSPISDVFIGNTSQTLNQLSKNNQLWKLPNIGKDIDPNFISPSQNWLPIALRFRVLAYNRDNIKPENLPNSILEIEKFKQFKGRIGWAPLDPGFQEIIGRIISTQTETKAREWLKALIALEPQDYGTGNTGMLEDLGNGLLDVVFAAHTQTIRIQRAGYHINAFMFQAGDVGNLKDSSGAGILKSSVHKVAALKFLKYLIGAEAQAFIYGVNFEYPAAANVPYPATLMPYQDVKTKALNLSPETTEQNIVLGKKLLTELEVL
jgi:iron(III) transport system substrate-binding protein